MPESAPDPLVFDTDTLPPVMGAWVRQLFTFPNLLAMVEDGGQVEVRLFCNQNQVRKDPVIVLNAGPSTMVGT